MKKLTILDIIIIIFSFLIIIFLIYNYFFLKVNSKKELFIKTIKEEYFYNLDQKKSIEINGETGKTIIEVDNGRFRFIESACPNKDCINTGWISYPNYPVICLPNKVSAYIISKKENDLFDSITR